MWRSELVKVNLIMPVGNASVNTLLTVSCSDLLVLVASGDRTALRSLYSFAGPKLFAICLKMMKNRAEAEDVFQDAFVKIWERSWQYDATKGEALAWLATVTRNTALDRLRAPRRQHVSIDDDVTAEIDKAMSVDMVIPSGDLNRCLTDLRQEYRDAVVLAFVNGYTHEELAQKLGKPLGTIKSWVSRGLKQLKECMEQ
jgi:RNA polymerase sigma-70 factor, ECF subfamily